MRLEDRLFIDAQRARDVRSERVARLLERDVGKWVQFTGAAGLYVDALTPPPVEALSLAAVGIAAFGHVVSARRTDELRRLNAEGRAHVWFSKPCDVLYRSDEAALPRSIRIDGSRCSYRENAQIEGMSGDGYIRTAHVRMDDTPARAMIVIGPTLVEAGMRADLITRPRCGWHEIVRAYPVD